MDKYNKIQQLIYNIRNVNILTFEEINFIKNELNENEKMDLLLLYNDVIRFVIDVINNDK